jgi:hypothetical protein
MEVGPIITEIEHLLAREMDHQKLCAGLETHLTQLREEYRRNAKQFTKQQIQFLSSLGTIIQSIQRFAEIQQELDGPLDLKEYKHALQELKKLSSALGPAAVAARVKKEIRQLTERSSEVIQLEESKQNFKMTGRTCDLEDQRPACPNNKHHRLKIREGSHGYFWGCSFYPSCSYSKPLTPAEHALLKDRKHK